MPIIAVVAAVAIDAGVFAGGISAITTLGAITAIGATVGAIGAVTGNKDLALAGGALGLVGGIGSLASSAGLFDGSSSLFGSATDQTGAAVSDAFDTASDTAIQGAENSAATANIPVPPEGDITTAAGGINSDAINPTGMINSSTIAPAEGNAAAIETGGNPNGVLAQSLSPSTTGVSSGSGTAAAGATETPFVDPATGAITQTSAPTLAPGFGSDLVPQSMLKAPGLGDASPGFLGNLLKWGKDNPMLAYGITQAGGSFISGLTNPLTPAQINALNAQAAANNAAAALAQREAANMGQPVPKATTSAPTVTGAPTGGLINTRPVTSPPVTGAPIAPAAQLVTGAIT